MDTGTLEEEIWVRAACHVLSKEGRPMHYMDIKRGILQKQLVGAGLQTTLESALYKEIQRPSTKLRRVENMPGVFTLQTDATAVPSAAAGNVTAKSGSKTGQVWKPGSTSGQGAVKSGSSTGHAGATSGVHGGVNGSVDRYRHKYRKLKRYIKQMVFVNGAVCDEVNRMEEKVAKVREERRFLLKRLLLYQPAPDPLPSPPPAASTASMTLPSTTASPASLPTPKAMHSATSLLMSTDSSMGGSDSEKSKTKKVKNLAKKRVAKEAEDLPAKKLKRGKSSKRLVQPIPLDSSGRPLFPIELGQLTVHSLGEIVNDRPRFHTVDQIYPVGFCSTRLYASIKQPTVSCLYTCKILDAGLVPQFEISPDEDPDFVITSKDPSECHRKLLRAINSTCGRDIIPINGKGAEFFGLSHPTIQNLTQSSPGARKCSSYKWVRFEVCKSEAEIPLIGDDDPVINFDALQQLIKELGDQGASVSEPSSSLRSLLTSAPLMQTPH